jgi:hypothetical protein
MWIWRYNRSRLISFVFSCKNDQEKVRSWFTKVVLFFTKNPTKFSLYFSEFSTFFYEFSMFQPKPKYYLRSYFACRPLEVSFLLWIGARFANKTLERSRCSQCSPWAWRAARPAKIPVIWRRSRPRKGRRGGSRAHRQPVCGRCWGRGGSGGGVRRRRSLECRSSEHDGLAWATHDLGSSMGALGKLWNVVGMTV